MRAEATRSRVFANDKAFRRLRQRGVQRARRRGGCEAAFSISASRRFVSGMGRGRAHCWSWSVPPSGVQRRRQEIGGAPGGVRGEAALGHAQPRRQRNRPLSAQSYPSRTTNPSAASAESAAVSVCSPPCVAPVPRRRDVVCHCLLPNNEASTVRPSRPSEDWKHGGEGG